MATTYEKIASTTLGTAAADITFSSIPSTYTDLRLVFVGTAVSGANLIMKYNGSSTYCTTTFMQGNGSSPFSANVPSSYLRPFFLLNNASVNASTLSFFSIDIFSYTGNTFKTCLIGQSEDQNGAGVTGFQVGLWPSTSAITSILFSGNGTNLEVGTTATIYGIKGA